MSQLYGQHLGPIVFGLYAAAIAQRLDPSERGILETAAGTGIVTGVILAWLPSARVAAVPQPDHAGGSGH